MYFITGPGSIICAKALLKPILGVDGSDIQLEPFSNRDGVDCRGGTGHVGSIAQSHRSVKDGSLRW